MDVASSEHALYLLCKRGQTGACQYVERRARERDIYGARRARVEERSRSTASLSVKIGLAIASQEESSRWRRCVRVRVNSSYLQRRMRFNRVHQRRKLSVPHPLCGVVHERVEHYHGTGDKPTVFQKILNYVKCRAVQSTRHVN